MPIRDLLLMGTIFGSLPLCFLRPYIGILIGVWLSLMNPHRLTWSYAYAFPVVKVVVGVTLLGFLFSSEKGKLPKEREIWVLLALGLVFTMTTRTAFYPDSAWDEWINVVKIYVMVFLILYLCQDRNKLRWLLITMALSIGFYGVKGGIFSILKGGQHVVWGPPKSIIAGNNELALAELMVFPMLFYLGLQEKKDNPWLARSFFVAAFLTLISVVFSYSRGAFLSLGAMVFLFLLRTKRRFLYLVPLVILGAGLLVYAPDRWFERMGTIQTYEEDPSAMGRLNAWGFAYNVAKDRPLTGGGFQAFQREVFFDYAPDPLDFHDAHSVYFEVLGEHGFLGLSLFLILMGLSYRSLAVLRAQTKKVESMEWAHDYCTMLQLSLVVYSVGGAFLGLAYFDLYYFLIAAVVLMKVIVRDELAKLQEAREPVDEQGQPLKLKPVAAKARG